MINTLSQSCEVKEVNFSLKLSQSKVNIGMLGALGTLGFSQLISRILDEIVGIGQSFLPCAGIEQS